MKKYLMNLFKYRNLLFQLVKRDITIKYRRSALGVLWSLINPLLTMLVLNLVFSSLFKVQIDNFLIYLLTGQIMFLFLTEATISSMQSVIGSSSLINKVYIPKYIFPVSKVLSAFVNLLFSFIAVLIIMVATNVKLTLSMLWVPILFIYLLIFVLGLGILLAAYTVFFRDVIYLYGVFTTLWMYMTPIIYPVNIIPDKYRMLINLNPMFHYIEAFRTIVIYGEVPTLMQNFVCLTMSLVMFAIGTFTFYKKQDKFIMYL